MMIKLVQNILLTGIILITISSCSKKFMVVDTPVEQPPARIIEHRPEVALVLGGGAFHGMAHVGVIKILEEEGIPIDLIVGTSAGSLVGAFYADNPNIDSLYPLALSTTTKDVFDFSLFRSKEGFISGKRLQQYLTEHISSVNIQDTKVPFVAVTTDLEKGISTPLKAGPIAASINASCAIPGIFEPVKMYGTTFVDGGVLAGIPVGIAQEYNPKVIIAISIMAFDTVPDLKNYKDVFKRSYVVAAHNSSNEYLKLADIIISPNLAGIPLMSGKEAENEKMYKLGMEAGKKAMPEIKQLLKEKGVRLKN